jgi:hypothetical protein
MRRPFPIWKVPVQAGGSRGPSTPQTPVGMTQKNGDSEFGIWTLTRRVGTRRPLPLRERLLRTTRWIFMQSSPKGEGLRFALARRLG